MAASLIITESAKGRIAELLVDEAPGSKLRISVLGGGCSGFQYRYSFDQTFNSDDCLLEDCIAIDEMSLSLVDGSTFDYVEDLGSAGFEMKNPNATAKCGCGNSFSI